MTGVLWWLAQNTITIALAVVLVAIMSRLLPKRPAVQHAMWVVVLIKFITPPLVVWPWSVRSLAESLAPASDVDDSQALSAVEPGSRWLGSSPRALSRTGRDPDIAGSQVPPLPTELAGDPSLQSTEPHGVFGDDARPAVPAHGDWLDRIDGRIEPQPAELLISDPSLRNRGERTNATSPYDLEAADGVTTAADNLDGSVAGLESSSSNPGNWFVVTAGSFAERWRLHLVLRLVFVVWLAGGVVAGMGQCRRIARYVSVARRGRTAPDYLTEEVGRVAAAMGMRPVSVLVVRGIASPFVWCLGWLRLLWPDRLSGEADVVRCRGVIAHELAHVRRHDHWVAWLELLAGLVWWWNPCFWYVRRRLHEASEIACDAVALSVLPSGRREYAEALLELSSIGKMVAPVPALGVSSGVRRTLERRFAMILSERVVSKISPWGLVVAGLVAMVTLPSWSLGQVSPSGKPERSPSSSDEPAGLATQSAARESPNPIPSLRESTPLSGQPDDGIETSPSADSVRAQKARPAAAERRGDSLESRVQKLEEKLDAILQELQTLRTQGSTGTPGANRSAPSTPSGAGQKTRLGPPADNRVNAIPAGSSVLKVFPLKYAAASQLQETLRVFVPSDVRISSDERTNFMLVAGPEELVESAGGIISILDVPADQDALPTTLHEDVTARSPGAKLPARGGQSLSRLVASDTQLDLVSLGTATIEARGALRLAQVHYDRLKQLHSKAVASEEQVITAEINLDTAQQKVDLLTSIARSAIDSVKAELAAAPDSTRARQLYEKGYATQSQVEQAEAQVAAATAKLKLLESIVNQSR